MEYKVGDRVRIKSLDWYNENRNDDWGTVVLPHGNFYPSMARYCGEILTITGIHKNEIYITKEGGSFNWTDEMIEGLVEETKPEFNIGDKITDGKTHLTILNIISDKYIVEDNFGKCGTLYFNSQDYWKLVEEEVELVNEFNLPDGYIFKDENGNVINANKIVLEKLVVPKFKVGDKVKDKNNRVWFIVRVSETFFDISSVNIPNAPGYFVPMEDQDDYELIPDRELPKTFEECVRVLEGENRVSLEQMNTFRKLIDARNAYWKIYGEENGLGKPWEPTTETVYCISRSDNVIKCSYRGGKSNILEFPTEEMRDAFYENFKEEIEICKEFL